MVSEREAMSTTDCLDQETVLKITGPLLIGYQFNWALYGVLCAQVFIYHQGARIDGLVTRVLVYGLLIVETVQIGLSTHDAFHQLVFGWGEEEGLEGLYYTWFDLPILTGFVSCITQCYYAWRIYVLSRSQILGIAIVLLALMQFGGAFAEGMETKLLDGHSLLEIPADTFAPTTVWLAGSAACDLLISVSMTRQLSKSKFGFAKVDAVLNSLVRLVIETGFATSVCAIIELSMFLGYKNTTYYVTPALILSKLYSNSLLVLLNSHIPLRHDVPGATSTGISARIARNVFQGSGALHLEVNHNRDEISMVEFSPVKDPDESYLSLKGDIAM